MITNIRNLPLVVVAAMALALSACGGGGGNGPVTSKPMPKVVNLGGVAASAMRPATDEPIVIAPGQSMVHGDVTFSCAAGGPACMVAVAEDGTVSSTGGMVAATNSEAFVQRMTVADAVGVAETAIDALSRMSSHAEVAAAESLLSAAKTALEVAAALSMADRDALNGRIQTVETNLDEARKAIADRRDMDEMERQRLAVDAIGVAEAAISALSDMPTDAEINAAESLLAAAKSALADATALSTADRDALDGRIQTVEMNLDEARARIAHALHGLEQSIEAISAAIDEAEFLTDALSRTSSDADLAAVEALLAAARAALEAFPPDAILDPLYWRIRIIEEHLASIRTDIVAHRTAVANVIDLAANDNRQDELGEFIGGWWRREAGTGGQQASVTRSYDGGGSVNAILSYDESGQLQHNVAIFQNKSYQQLETTDIRVRVDRAGRYINTHEDPQELEGVTRSTRSIPDHGLGAEWQVTELTSDYDGGGTLKIHVATDVKPADGSVDPFATVASGYGNIEFSDAPALPADRDILVVRFDHGHGVEGTLGGDAGFFYCPAGGCLLSIDRRSGGYYAVSAGLTFTPDGGTAQPVPPALVDTAPAANYLAFGHWLYVPDDAVEPDDVPPTRGYDFGVFASGGDPFTAANLRALTGTATYEGDAVGMYYVDGLSSSPTVGSFSADVQLIADFGDRSATGFVSGEVNDFEFEHDVASSLPETVMLASRTYDYLPEAFDVPPGSTNIFDTPWRDETAPYPGGWVGGATQASAEGQDWYGSWSGAFYGNGPAATGHPTSVAGEFSSYPWGDGNHNQRDTGLTGSFGAHKIGKAPHDPGNGNGNGNGDDSGNGNSWSDSPWVAAVDTFPQWGGVHIFYTNPWVAGPGMWIGSEYQLQLNNSVQIPKVGEVGSLSECFYGGANIFNGCFDDDDGVDTIEYSAFHGVQIGPDGVPVKRLPIELVWARGRNKFGDEQMAGVFGFTELGYWAVGWTEEADDAYTTHGDFVSSAFSTPTHYAIRHGHIDDYQRVRTNLEHLPNDQTWSAKYHGWMTGIAHQHGNFPVFGGAFLNAEFADDSRLNSVELTVFDIKGDGFVLPNIEFPIIDDGDCCNGKKPGGYAGRDTFELDYGGMYLDAGFVGPARDEVHGEFSTPHVSGAFGAIQTDSENRPPLAQ